MSNSVRSRVVEGEVDKGAGNEATERRARRKKKEKKTSHHNQSDTEAKPKGTDHGTHLVAVSVVFNFMEVVFIKLTDEAGEIGMLEHFRQDRLCEFRHILSAGSNRRQSQMNSRPYTIGLTLTTKQSPVDPQQTTCAKHGSSSILRAE